MPAALWIDTLKFAKRLTDAGLSREAAEAIVENEADLSELATRADLSELATRADVTEVKTDITELKTDIATLRTNIIAELRADIYGRLWVMGAGIVALTVALMKLLPAG